jgi:hypothetical protein
VTERQMAGKRRGAALLLKNQFLKRGVFLWMQQ